MKELSQDQIRSKALSYHKSGQNWHFHILTPTCKFNLKRSYAFVLEGPEGNFVNYSDSPASELGKELAPLAHKADVVAGDVGNYKPSDTVSRILDRAKSLTKAGLEWHHHVTFKGCQFHQGDANFNLVFEDPKVPEPIISSSDHEPIDDLKLIEPLFYSQHSKS